jgi:nondiscriminating aspartyl-tRNA synthetase
MSERRILLQDLPGHVGTEVTVRGWVYRIRSLGKVNFVILRDGTGFVQTFWEKDIFERAGLMNEMYIQVRGSLVGNEKVVRGFEVQVKDFEVISRTHYGEAMPLEISNPTVFDRSELDYILKHRTLSLRNLGTSDIFRIQSEIAWAFREYLRNEGFTEVHTPKIVATGTEGGADLFKVQYFDRIAYLAQSPQFYKQIMVGVFEKVFEVGHVYRAEKHYTSRHVNEYVSLDFEMGPIRDHRDVMAVESGLLRFLFDHLRERYSGIVKEHGAEIPQFDEIPEIKMADAIEILEREYGKVSDREDLDPESERKLCEYFKEHEGVDLVFVTHYPVAKRPMYTMRDPDDPGKTKSFDLLFRGVEVTTGSQRIHDYEMLVENIRSLGLDPDDFEHYLDVFRYGMPPHGGLAIGLERLTAQLLNIPNIRLACLFPRDKTRVTP